MELEESTFSHQDSRVPVQKQKYRPLEQDREPGNKPMHLWAPYFLQRRQEYTTEKEQSLLSAGKLESYM